MKPSHLGTDWRDQWERVKRWHRRLERIRAAPPLKGAPEEPQALDEVFAFFMNCYHLADWLANDHDNPHPEVWPFVEGSEPLRLCRDVCNGLKHYRLDPAKRTTHNPNWTTTAISEPVVITGQGSRLVGPRPPRWVFLTDQGERDMFAVADECMEAWTGFIEQPRPLA